MNTNDNALRRPELLQFVRSKGKMVPLVENGRIIRDRKGKVVMLREKGAPRGVLVAGMVDGEVRIGWSYTNKKLGDSFDKEFGINVSMNRLNKPSRLQIPHKVMKEINNSFIPRCEEYFGVKFA